MGDSRYINLDIKQNEEIDVVMIDESRMKL